MDNEYSKLALAIVAVIVPLAVTGLKVTFTKVPKAYYPIIATLLGPLCDYAVAKLMHWQPSPFLGVLAGGAGVALREIVNQLVKHLRSDARGEDNTTTLLRLLALCIIPLFMGCSAIKIRQYKPIGDTKLSVTTEIYGTDGKLVSRKVEQFNPVTSDPVETQTFYHPWMTKAVMQGAKFSNTSSIRKDGTETKSHRWGLDYEGGVDSEGLQALGEAVGAGIAAGMKKAVTP